MRCVATRPTEPSLRTRAAARRGVVLAALLACLAACGHSPNDCPWSGDGAVTITVIEGDSRVAGGSSNCASGVLFNSDSRERQIFVCGSTFEFALSLAGDDADTGRRALTNAPSVTAGHARIGLTAISGSLRAVYVSEADTTGSVTLTANSNGTHGRISGAYDAVRMVRQSCPAEGCEGFPAVVHLAGTFSAVAP